MTPTRVTFGEAEVITWAVVYYIRKRDRVSVGWVKQSETQHYFRLSRLG
jgi:hypothetical protein